MGINNVKMGEHIQINRQFKEVADYLKIPNKFFYKLKKVDRMINFEFHTHVCMVYYDGKYLGNLTKREIKTYINVMDLFKSRIRYTLKLVKRVK